MFNRIAKFDQLGQATKKADKLLRSGEFDAMVKLWTDFLENDPNCAQAYFERGVQERYRDRRPRDVGRL